MDFRTELPATSYTFKISLADKLISIGSCFADTMALKLKSFKFNTVSNPFGIIYNPISLLSILNPAVSESKNSIKTEQGWQSLDVHSEIKSTTREQLAEDIQLIKSQLITDLASANVLIITWGTAWVYRLKSTNEIVANCLKQPATLFHKELLTEKIITDQFTLWYQDILKINPTLKIILTVSPVRHIKDTIELNSVSKSILRLACHTLSQQFEHVVYFPSFEIMMDDLRDYRFYKSDLIHPTEFAENYIWEKWTQSFLDTKTLEHISQWKKVQLAMQHKPFDIESESHQKFIASTIKQLENFSSYIDISEELTHFKQQLNR